MVKISVNYGKFVIQLNNRGEKKSTTNSQINKSKQLSVSIEKH